MTAAEEPSLWTLIAASHQSTAASDREEVVWVARVRTGDAAAIRWLLARYRAGAVRLAAHVLARRHVDEAEDIAQEAFVRVFRSLPQLRSDEGFSAWLYRIVVRLCLNRQRSARWQREIATGESLESSHYAASESEGVDTRLLVETLMQQLAPRLRAALALRELEGLEYEEIARILGIPIGTVRSHLNTARARFRELWLAATDEENHV